MFSRRKINLALALVLLLIIVGLIQLSAQHSHHKMGLPGRFVSSIVQVLQRHNFLPGDPLNQERSIRDIKREENGPVSDADRRPFYVTLFDLDRDVKMVSQLVSREDLRRGIQLWELYRGNPILSDPDTRRNLQANARELIEKARQNPQAIEQLAARLESSERFRELFVEMADQPFPPELSWGPSFAGAGAEAESELLRVGILMQRGRAAAENERLDRTAALRSLSHAARLSAPQFVAPLENQQARAEEMQGVVDQWSQLADAETDGIRVERNQRELNQLALHARDRINRVDSPPMRDLFSRMQRLSPEPYDRFELYSPDKLADEYKSLSRRYLELYEEKVEQADPERLAEMRRQLDRELERVEEIARAAEYWNSDQEPEDLQAYRMAEEIDWTQKANLARIDLLRLENAEKLYSRMGFTEELQDLDILTPVLETPPPMDPTCDRAYVYDPHEDFFYALGPDGQDDGGRILYDPSNGTRSSGDIFLPAFRSQDLISSPTRSGP